MKSENHWPKYLSLLSFSLLASTSLVVLVIFISLGLHAYPSADDFCMATGVRDEGLLAHLWSHYLQWSGRYTGNALYAIYPLMGGLFTGYAYLAAIIIILLFLATLFLLSTLFNTSLSDSKLWLYSLIFVACYVLGLRHTASSLYWMAGALTYQSGHILLLLVLTFLLRLGRYQQQKKSLSSTVLALLLLTGLAVGSNELMMVTVTLLFAIGLIIVLVSAQLSSRVWWVLFLFTLFCVAIVYMSPGNAIRESTFPLRHDWIRSIRGSFEMGSWTLLVWSGNPVFIATSLLTPFAAWHLYGGSSREIKVRRGFLVILGLMTFILPLLLQFPAWWAMGGWPPPRSVDSIFFLFFVCWITLLGAATIRFMPVSRMIMSGNTLSIRAGSILLVISIVYVLSLSISAKLKTAWQDLRHRVVPFAAYMQQRHRQIEASLQQGVYYVNVPAPPIELPRSIYFNDIRPDWRDWRNVCYANYFGLSGIQRQGQPASD